MKIRYLRYFTSLCMALLLLMGCGEEKSPVPQSTVDVPVGAENESVAPRDALAYVRARQGAGGFRQPPPETSASDTSPDMDGGDTLARQDRASPPLSMEARRAWIEEAAQSGNTTAIAQLSEIARNPDSPLSPMAVFAIARLDGRHPLLFEACRDARAEVRRAALRGLIEAASSGADRQCARHLADDPDAGARAIAAGGLGALGAYGELELLRDRLWNDAPEVRLGCAWSLARLGDDSGLDWLSRTAMGNDPDYGPRAAAAMAMVDNPAARSALARLVTRGTIRVQRVAGQALIAMPNELREAALRSLPPRETSEVRRRLNRLMAGTEREG